MTVYLVFQHVEGDPLRLQMILDKPADMHVCLGDLIATRMDTDKSAAGSRLCIRVMKEAVDSGKGRWLRGLNEQFYLDDRKANRQRTRDLGQRWTDYIKTGSGRISRDKVDFLPHTYDFPFNDAVPHIDKKLEDCTEELLRQKAGQSMAANIKEAQASSSADVFVVGRLRECALWQLKLGAAVPRILKEDYRDRQQSVTFEMQNEAQGYVVLPGSAKQGYYCLIDTGSKRVTLARDKDLT